MEAKVSNLIQNPSFFEKNSKKLNLEKNKNFDSTLKTYGQGNKEIDKLENKSQKTNIDRNKLRSNKEKEDTIKNKEQIKDFEDPVEKDNQNDQSISYKRDYSLFFNIFQNIIQNDDELNSENLSLEQDNIKRMNLESLSQFNIDEANKNILDDDNILEKLSDLQASEIGIEDIMVGSKEKIVEDKNLLASEENLGKDSNVKFVDDKNLRKENKVNVEILKTNENKNTDESKQVLNKVKDEFLKLENLSKEETGSLNDNNKSKEFKLEDNSTKEEKKDMSVKDKIDFTLERHEVKATNTNNVETKDQEPVNKKQFMEHIVEKVKFQLGNDKSQIKITLKPESLGEMIMEVEVVKNSLVAKIMVDNQRAKAIIENNLFQLKEGVKDTGLEIKTFEVFVGSNSDFNKHNSNEFNFNGRNKKIKVKGENKDNKIGLYEDNVKVEKTNLLNLYSGSSLNLLA